MNFAEKVSYLRGLLEGMNIDQTTNEAKIYNAILEILDDAAITIADLEDEVAELQEYVEELDSDLGELEEVVMDAEECDCCGGDEDDDYIYEAECPKCGELLALEDDVQTDDEIICPECGERFEIELPDDDDCDCDDECCCHEDE